MSELAVNESVKLADERECRVLQLLGEGLTAEVYKAEMADSGRVVALKVLKPGLSADFTQSFKDEPNILSELRDAERRANDGLMLIPELIARPSAQGLRRILAMEYVASPSIPELIEEQGPLPERTVLTITQQVLRILHLLHTELRRSYTDFQLRNIRWQADKQQVKLIDWNHTSPPASEGEAPPGVASDLVRMGAFLYQMLTGKGAMQTGETAGILAARAGEMWSKDISTGTRAIVEQALHPNPERRFPTADAFRRAVLAQITLWDEDEDDLDDATTTAMRDIRNEERQRDPVQLQRAATLVDMFARRRPSTRTAQWREEIARYSDQISPAWGSGRQYYRVDLYSKAVELWAEEALAWNRPDLWRWLIIARQAAADPTAYPANQPEFEAVLELMAGEHWTEAGQRLHALPGGPVDDLGREAKIHQLIAAAEADERAQPPRTQEAARNYRQALATLSEIEDEAYRAVVQDVFGWAGLEKRAGEAEMRGKQLASDAKAVADLRALPRASTKLVGGIVAALRASPQNVALLDFAAERAGDETLEPELRKEIALAALSFGNPLETTRRRLESQSDKARREIERRLADEKEAEAARLRQEEVAREVRRRQEDEAEQERVRLEEEARKQRESERRQQETLAEQQRLRDEQIRLGQLEQQEAHTRRQQNRLALSQLLTQREWDRIAARLSADPNNVPDELPRQVQGEFDAAVAAKRQDKALQFAAILDLVDPANRDKRARQLEQMALNQDALRDEANAIRGLLAVADADLRLEPPNLERARGAYNQARAQLSDLKSKNSRGKWAGLLPVGEEARLEADVRSLRERLDGRGDNDSDDDWRARFARWLKRNWPLLLTGLFLLLAGLGLGLLIDQIGGDEGTPVAELTAAPTATEVGALPPVATATATPTATATVAAAIPTTPAPATPTVTITPTIAITPSPLPPTPTLEPIDLQVGFLSATLPNQPGVYFDLPDMALVAPDGSTFDWSGPELQLVNADLTRWTMSLIRPAADGTTTTEPIAREVVVSNETPPADPAEVTSGPQIRLEWARQPKPPPWPAGSHAFNIELRGPEEQTRIVAGLTPVTIAPPVPMVVPANNNYRILPLWDPNCDDAGRKANNQADLPVDAIGKVMVKFDQVDAWFIQIRLPNTRQIYWLGGTTEIINGNLGDFTTAFAQVPEVTAPTGSCPAPTP